MPDQDAAENKALEAAKTISDQIGTLWMSAHCDGIRNGMETAAQVVQSGIDTVAHLDEIGEDVRNTINELLARVRDAIRFAALQIEDPETT